MLHAEKSLKSANMFYRTRSSCSK